MAASPAKTYILNEASLASMWKQTNGQLDAMWDIIGLTAEERRAAVIAIGEKLAAVAAQFVQSAQGDKKALQEEIHADRNQIVDTCKRLNKIYLQDEYIKLDHNATLREQVAQLKAQLNQLNQIKEQHESKIREALNELHALWNRLGTALESGYEGVVHDISEQKVVLIQQKVVEANADISKRVAMVTDRVKECNELISDMGLVAGDLTGPLDTKIVAKDIHGLGVHIKTVEALDEKITTLKHLKSVRQQKLQALAVEINGLWNRLKVKESERQAFLSRHSGLTTATIHACEMELNRLKALKKERLPEFWAEAKQKLIKAWDESFVHPMERAKFKPAASDVISEESLESFELEIAKVEARAAKMAPLLTLIKERNSILEDKANLEKLAATVEPSMRYKIGKFALKEEKLRNQLQHRMPKLNEMLRAQIPLWEKENGTLLLNGVPYLASMAQDEEAAAAEKRKKEAEKEGKKKENQQHAAPARPNTASAKKPAVEKTPSKSAAAKAAKTPSSGLKRPSTAVASASKGVSATPASSKKLKTDAAGAGARPVLGQRLDFNDS